MQGQRADDEQPTNSVPVLRYSDSISEDFALMVGADGRHVCIAWSLRKMNVLRSYSECVLEGVVLKIQTRPTKPASPAGLSLPVTVG